MGTETRTVYAVEMLDKSKKGIAKYEEVYTEIFASAEDATEYAKHAYDDGGYDAVKVSALKPNKFGRYTHHATLYTFE